MAGQAGNSESNRAQNAPQPGQKYAGHWDKSELRLGRKCPTTNNNTIKETKEVTTATPTPLPACGQASALLTTGGHEETRRRFLAKCLRLTTNNYSSHREHGEKKAFADMSGDGLTDLVRIRNGEVCYWPNFGYGKFGTGFLI